jgi:hypothetical protein
MGTADVVQVRVRQQQGRLTLEKLRSTRTKGLHTQPGVNHQVVVAAAKVPDIAAKEGVNMRLGD